MMKILVDQSVHDAKSVFGSVADLHFLETDAINAETLQGFDGLLCRSTLKIDSELLKNTTLKWVGNTVSGTDHIDQSALENHNVQLFSAAGCNAIAVRDYVLNVLHQAQLDGRLKPEFKIAIIGVGNVGSCLAEALNFFGIETTVCDPFRSDINHTPLDQIRNQDVVTIHTPLTRTGNYATFEMLDQAFFDQQNPNALFLNAARAEVVNESVLETLLDTHPVALDVWHHEPHLKPEHLQKAYIATPHIAGHTQEAKARGTWMVFNQLAKAKGWPLVNLPQSIGGRIQALKNLAVNLDLPEISRALKTCQADFKKLRSDLASRLEWRLDRE